MVLSNFAFVPQYGFGVMVLFVFAVIPLWVLFVMPTKCDFEVKGRGCVRDVNGKACGCFQHNRLKRDAIFAACGMRNPGMAFRVMWLDSTSAGRALGGRPEPGRVARNRQVTRRTVPRLASTRSRWSWRPSVRSPG